MFQNYFKIAVRNLWKHKLFSVINIFGLASGLMVCFLVIAHSKAVLSYDRFQPKRERIYRIITDVKGEGQGPASYATSPLCVAPALKRDYDFVEEITRVIPLPKTWAGNDKRLEAVVLAVDPGFFTLFQFPLEKGQPATAPFTVVITPKTANRFFGTTNPIGKLLYQERLGLLTITGVLAEVPLNTHLKFDALVSLSSFPSASKQGAYWDWQQYANGYTYTLLKTNTSVDRLQHALSRLVQGVNVNTVSSKQIHYSLRPQALTQLSPAFEMLNGRMLNEKYIGELISELLVGLITLLMAGFNYVNLTLARSFGRVREVGVRKVLGALKRQVLGQFIVESVVVALGAFCLAYLMTTLTRSMPAIQLWLLSGVAWDVQLWLVLIGFTLLIGVLAGWVPAKILARLEPAIVFRSYSGLQIIRGLSFRKALTVAQFAFSLIAMIVLLTLSRQFQFFTTADYGFRQKGLLTIPLHEQAQRQRFENELRQLADVDRVTASSGLLSELNEIWYVRRYQNRPDSLRAVTVAVDTNFIQTMNLSLVAGTNLPAQVGLTSNQKMGRFILINEEAVRRFQFGNPAKAVGRTLWIGDSNEVEVAGVVKNFRYSWLSQPIQPLLLFDQPNRLRWLSVSVAEGAENRALSRIKSIWKRLLPYEPFLGEWYDAYLRAKYDQSKFTDVFILLIGVSLSIACLGLLGMVTYNLQMRVKEISMRKILGGTVVQIFLMISWSFSKLLLIALLIAYPIGFLLGNALLNNFAYRVSIGLETFGICFGLLVILGGLTIGIRTYQAAQANPVSNLRRE